MKLKRAAKDNEPLIAAAPAKPAAKTGNDSQALLPGAIAALGGLVLACALLGFGLSGSGKQQQQQLVEAWGGSQASALQQAQQQLLRDRVELLSRQLQRDLRRRAQIEMRN